jgi:hypothetical protein
MRCMYSVAYPHSPGNTYSVSLSLVRSLSFLFLCVYLSHLSHRFIPATYSDGGRKQKNIPIGGNQPLHDNLVDIQSSASQNLINGQQQ